MHRYALSLVLSCGAFVHVGAQDEPLSVANNVVANEALYSDLDVTYRCKYKLHHIEAQGAKQFYPILSQEMERRSVTQGGWYRFDSKSKTEKKGGEYIHQGLNSTYDGQITKVLQDKIGNVHQGRTEEDNLFRPHTFLFTRSFSGTLSRWLRDPGNKIAVESHTERIGESECTKLRCEDWQGGRYRSLTYLWLANNRNYLPIQSISYLPAYSKTIPVEMGTVSDFRELKHGIWLPFKGEIVIYNEIKARDGIKEISNTEEWAIKSAVLDPKHDVKFFQELTFPDGAAVYDVVNGKIVADRVEGHPEIRQDLPTQSRLPSAWRQVLIWLTCLVFLSASIAFCYRRVRYKRDLTSCDRTPESP